MGSTGAVGKLKALLPTSPVRRGVWVGTAVTTCVLILLPEILKLDGQKHADWLQFLAG